jgi:hypothetical protein
MLDYMKGEGLIEESKGPWSSPVVLVRKKNRDLRLCVDYRKLNNVTKRDCFPLPRIDDTLDTLAGAKCFSTLDLKSGYWQVTLHPDDKEEDGVLHKTGAVAVYGYAVWALQRPGDVRTTDGVRSEGPDLRCVLSVPG